MDGTMWERVPFRQLKKSRLRQQVCLYEHVLNPLTRSIKAASDAFPLECLAILVPVSTSVHEQELCLAHTAAAFLHLDLLYLCRSATTLISNHVVSKYNKYLLTIST